MYQLTREQLRKDLQDAFRDAASGKWSKSYVRRFARNLRQNLDELCDELWEGRYKPQRSARFAVTYPKIREVFAAEFRDRIVHHLYYNYTHELFERTFIQDTYSCIPGRGTHYGIKRLEEHIRSESHGYTRPCYVLKLDISGYFMHIVRSILLDVVLESLDHMSHHRILKRVPTRWCDRLDFGFLKYLSREIILHDPTKNCIVLGDPEELERVPFGKRISDVPVGCGLPIGNLTSQEFSNVYLNVLAQYLKRVFKCEHCGHYVDDFYIVSCDKAWLLSLVPQIDAFIQDKLGLSLNRGKTRLYNVQYGVPFIGAFLKPGYKYIENKSLHNMYLRMDEQVRVLPADNLAAAEVLDASLNSYLGVLGHYHSYNIRRELMLERHDFDSYGMFNLDMNKFHAFKDLPHLPENIEIPHLKFTFENDALSFTPESVHDEELLRELMDDEEMYAVLIDR